MKIYLTLRDWIVSGTLQAGEKLNDVELAEYFSVSRTPIREAVQMLETQKLVTVVPNRVTVVSDVDVEHLEKLYQPLAHLQALGASLCCERITPAQIRELYHQDERVRQAVETGDIDGTLKEDLAFHNAILHIAENEYIEQFSETLMMHIQRIEYCYFKKSKEPLSSFASHHKILNAFDIRDAKAAFDATLDNWLTTMYRYKTILAENHGKI